MLLAHTNGFSQSKIITSKEKAVKKKIYSTPSSHVDEDDIADLTENKPVVKTTRSTKKTAKKAETKSIINTKNDDDIFIGEDTNYLVEQLINNASDNIGTRYRSGGTTKDGFDCSGLMYSTFKKFDITLPRSSFDMAKAGKVLERSEYQVGDLIFFKTFGKRISHVGMITEVLDDEIKFIHSSTSLGVIISSTKEAYYQRTFAQVNRVL